MPRRRTGRDRALESALDGISGTGAVLVAVLEPANHLDALRMVLDGTADVIVVTHGDDFPVVRFTTIPDGPAGRSTEQLPRPALDHPWRQSGVRLSTRELQVLRAMARGLSNARIARELDVVEDTVKAHAGRLYRKLGVRDRAQAVAVGFRAGLMMRTTSNQGEIAARSHR